MLLTWSTTDLLVLIENCERFSATGPFPLCPPMPICRPMPRGGWGTICPASSLSARPVRLSIPEEGADLHRALDDSILSARIFVKLYDASFAGEILPADEAFYDRITFKTFYISDIDSPLIPAANSSSAVSTVTGISGERGSGSSATAFYADFRCGECDRRYVGRIQCKRKYEGVVIKKKLAEKVKEGTAAGQAPEEGHEKSQE